MKKVICPECGAINKLNTIQCKTCGFELKKYISENHFDDLEYVNICPKCAKVSYSIPLEPLELKCSFCGSKIIHTNKTTAKLWKSIPKREIWMCELSYLTKDLEITNYSKEAYNERTKEARAYYYKTEQPVPRSTQNPTVTCPYCKSTNVAKISTVSRMASTSMVGLASKKIGKQWHCNNCKSDF